MYYIDLRSACSSRRAVRSRVNTHIRMWVVGWLAGIICCPISVIGYNGDVLAAEQKNDRGLPASAQIDCRFAVFCDSSDFRSGFGMLDYVDYGENYLIYMSGPQARRVRVDTCTCTYTQRAYLLRT